jgi:peptide/nickel transport system ATP-binding protein
MTAPRPKAQANPTPRPKAQATESATLEVTDLHVSFPTPDGVVRAVRGASFVIGPGATLGVVGESGSGKSVCAQTLLGLHVAADVSGSAMFRGRDLLTMREDDLRQIRGAQISMIFQDPLTSLHPLHRIGWQIAEVITAHEPGTGKRAARERAIELLGQVGIPAPRSRVDDYPHQFSGGMRQRAMIAMALALHPAVIIADEPTTALDATVQAQILQLLQRIQTERGTALMMITHDLAVVAGLADTVMVMYAGRPVEIADRRTLYKTPHHPYTQGLLRSLPGAPQASDAGRSRRRLTPIPGQPPSLIQLPNGCPFHPRCPHAMDRCRTEEPPLAPAGSTLGHVSACWLPPDQVSAA